MLAPRRHFDSLQFPIPFNWLPLWTSGLSISIIRLSAVIYFSCRERKKKVMDAAVGAYCTKYHPPPYAWHILLLEYEIWYVVSILYYDLSSCTSYGLSGAERCGYALRLISQPCGEIHPPIGWIPTTLTPECRPRSIPATVPTHQTQQQTKRSWSLSNLHLRLLATIQYLQFLITTTTPLGRA